MAKTKDIRFGLNERKHIRIAHFKGENSVLIIVYYTLNLKITILVKIFEGLISYLEAKVPDLPIF